MRAHFFWACLIQQGDEAGDRFRHVPGVARAEPYAPAAYRQGVMPNKKIEISAF